LHFALLAIKDKMPKGAGMGSSNPQRSAAKRGLLQTARYKCSKMVSVYRPKPAP